MKIRTLAVIAVLLLGLTLTACTRQASTATVPTQPASQPTSSVAEDPTMAAVRQTAAMPVRLRCCVITSKGKLDFRSGGFAASGNCGHTSKPPRCVSNIRYLRHRAV